MPIKDTDRQPAGQDSSILGVDANPADDPDGATSLTPGTASVRVVGGGAPVVWLRKTPQAATFEDLSPSPREYIWPPYLPRGGLGVVAGLGSHGKTTLSTAMCAWASSGLWPHAVPTAPVKSLILEFQDDDANEIKPKLAANGYNPQNVLRLIKKECPSFEELEALIREHGLGMVMISPGRRFVMRYVKNENNNSEVEPVLDRLHLLGKKTNCLIILIKHLNKREESSAVSRVSNASAWIDSPRTVIMVAKKNGENLRIIETVKNNESQEMKFEMTFTDVGQDAAPDNQTAYVRVTINETETGVDEVLAAQRGVTAERMEVLAFFAGREGDFHYREVAEALGRKEDTMKTQLNRMATAKPPLILRGALKGTFRGIAGGRQVEGGT